MTLLLIGAGALALSSVYLLVRRRVPARPRERVVLVGRPGATPNAPRVELSAAGAWPLPFIERAERLQLGPFAVQLSVRRARARGGARVDASLDARLSVQTGSSALLHHGLEALLGKSPDEIAALASVLLHGKLIAALAQHEPPETPGELDRVVAEVFFSAAPMLDTIALELDRETLVIDVRRCAE